MLRKPSYVIVQALYPVLLVFVAMSHFAGCRRMNHSLRHPALLISTFKLAQSTFSTVWVADHSWIYYSLELLQDQDLLVTVIKAF